MCDQTLDLYNELKGWQSGIGALLGFLALMIAAWYNFYLNRRRDDRLRTEEALSVAAALYGEMVLFRREAAALARAMANVYLNQDGSRSSVSKFDERFLAANKLPDPLIYNAMATKIGLLTPHLVLAIAEFYANYQEAKKWLFLLIEQEGSLHTYSFMQILVPACDAIIKIGPTLREIEQMASISVPTEEPELARVNQVIALEKEFFDRRTE